MLSDFHKEDPNDNIYWVEEFETGEDGAMEPLRGPLLFSFDKKNIFIFWTDYPYKLTSEQKAIFDKENPMMAALKNPG